MLPCEEACRRCFWSPIFRYWLRQHFLGNDPLDGLAVLTASFLFYLPLIDIVKATISSERRTALLVLLGTFILWSSFGLGELGDKVMIVAETFPHTRITEH